MIFLCAFTSTAGRRLFDSTTNSGNSSSSSSSSSIRSSDSIIPSTSTQVAAPLSLDLISEYGNDPFSLLDSSEYRGVIERNNRQNKLQIVDDSMDSCSQSSLPFHSYSKHSSVQSDDGSNVENVLKRSRCVLLNGQ